MARHETDVSHTNSEWGFEKRFQAAFAQLSAFSVSCRIEESESWCAAKLMALAADRSDSRSRTLCSELLQGGRFHLTLPLKMVLSVFPPDQVTEGISNRHFALTLEGCR